MTDPAATPPNGYRVEPGRYDDLVDASGGLRPHWERLARTWDTLGVEELARRQGLAERFLVAEGAGHLLHDDPGHADRRQPWRLDPLPMVVPADEWTTVERGIAQRVRLLDAVARDLNGERRLLRDGVVPMAAALGSGRYHLALVGTPRSHPWITCYAADVGRDATGRLLVVRDSTDVPTGAGQAHLHRAVLTRLFPDAHRELRVQGFAAWFSELNKAVVGAAPSSANPRAVVLAPDPAKVEYFEASYVAALLGFHLAQSDDLTVRGGRVWLRALGGLEPIDVVFRRVSAGDADPLELGGSGGVAGLTESERGGGVSIVNPLGGGVVDGLWLHPFLTGACEALLDEDLVLPSIETVWCGDPHQLETVLGDFGQYIVHECDAVNQRASVFGHGPAEDRDAVREQLRREPHRFVAQRTIDFATTPVLREGAILPGVAALRIQAVRSGDRLSVLPGGFGRVVSPHTALIDLDGGLGKDVWVTGAQIGTASVRLAASPLPQVDLGASLPTRTAEALYWLGRNAEHAETGARLARLVITRVEQSPDLVESEWGTAARSALARVTGGAPSTSTGDLAEELAAGLGDRPGGVVDSIGHLVRLAGNVRGYLSSNTWRIMNALATEEIGLGLDLAKSDRFEVTEALDRILTDLAAVSGLATESVVRGHGWRFLDLGRRLERALATLGLVEATTTRSLPPDVLQPIAALLLAGCESLVAYRRRYRSDFRIQTVLELVALDPTNPRAVAFQLDRIAEHLGELPTPAGVAPLRLPTGLLSLGTSDPAGLVLAARGPLLDLAEAIVGQWFTHEPSRAIGIHS